MKSPKNKTTVINVRESSELLTFLQDKLGGVTRSTAKQWLSHRQISVNGTIQTRFDFPLYAGDEVVLQSGAAKKELLHPKLRIVFEDDNLIVAEKKEGLLTVAAHEGGRELTCFMLLKKYVRQANPRAGIYVVHRLDRDTSGLLVFAKSPELQHYMREYWRELVTSRAYIAIAEGVIDNKEGEIRTWFTEDPKTTMVYSSPYDDGGKLAVTDYKVLRTKKSEEESLSLVELHLQTGRTNQIRVHLASIGHPIVGDQKYGHGTRGMRMMLHAKELEFIHPVTEETLHFETDIPREFLARMK